MSLWLMHALISPIQQYAGVYFLHRLFLPFCCGFGHQLGAWHLGSEQLPAKSLWSRMVSPCSKRHLLVRLLNFWQETPRLRLLRYSFVIQNLFCRCSHHFYSWKTRYNYWMHLNNQPLIWRKLRFAGRLHLVACMHREKNLPRQTQYSSYTSRFDLWPRSNKGWSSGETNQPAWVVI